MRKMAIKAKGVENLSVVNTRAIKEMDASKLAPGYCRECTGQELHGRRSNMTGHPVAGIVC